ncbi:Aste57867_20543 [Aphanomyces stellatus]|uniref:Aste57867_20543 protein n=1 Tax=Aphanomyces stellatus TaxID=120398 RepID=A0A485LGE4_9STRA|nr:hypothetical protein As57867_020476 [Aphanomyces stellatus]VFT97228.1 Aste57867_20543 [Aphanomyces stellatus]
MLASRRHRGYGSHGTMWEHLIWLHFGRSRYYEPTSSFRELPIVFQNPHWSTSCAPEMDELSLSCREYLETAMEYSLFEAIHVVRGDIGRITLIGDEHVDCLIFPTNSSLVNFGIGAAGAVFNRAGPELLTLVRSEAYRRTRRRTTDAILTPGFDSGVDHLIHCVGPSSHRPDCEDNLYRTYLNALDRARQVDARCVAVASISTGSLGFPVDLAAQIAMRACRDFIKCHRWQATIGIVCLETSVLSAMTRKHEQILRQFNKECLEIVARVEDVLPPLVPFEFEVPPPPVPLT